MVDMSSAVWRKSTLSTVNGCVEVAFVESHVAVRDSKEGTSRTHLGVHGRRMGGLRTWGP